jgi:hypothetical protein
MKTLARFTIRPHEDGKGDLILGALYKAQNADLLKPGVIYEIREVMGELQIVDVGASAIRLNMNLGPIHVCWQHSVDYILSVSGKVHLLTENEFKEYSEPINVKTC